MGEVHDIGEARPHTTGRARCLDCKHEWIAVAPCEMVWLDCPSCTLVRGRYIFNFERSGYHWTCQCGCDLFHVSAIGVYCPNCGEWQYGWYEPTIGPAA